MRCMSGSSDRCAIISMRFANAGSQGEDAAAVLRACGLCSWSRCSLGRSSRCMRRPARRVTFRAEDGATLTGAYYEPSRRPAPGIVLLHMLRRSHADWDAAASQLSDAGFAVLALDYRGGDDLGAYADRRESGESISARAARGGAEHASASPARRSAPTSRCSMPRTIPACGRSRCCRRGSTTEGCAPKRR